MCVFPLNPQSGTTAECFNYLWTYDGYGWVRSTGAGGTISGNYISNINGLTGGITLAAGSNITLTPAGNTITIASSGGPTGTIPTDYVISFNGTTGAVTGASLGANTFTALNTFNAGISASGATFDGNIYVTGNLIVTGRIETSTGIFGATANAIIEPVDNMNLDGGEF